MLRDKVDSVLKLELLNQVNDMGTFFAQSERVRLRELLPFLLTKLASLRN